MESTVQTSGGVVLYGCNSGGISENVSGRISNTNAFPVRIRQVVQYNSEKTRSMYQIEPGTNHQLAFIYVEQAFYIYTMDGGLVGYISSECPR